MKLWWTCVATAIAIGAPSTTASAWSVVVATEDYFMEFDPDLVRRQGPFAMAWTRLTFTNLQPAKDDSGSKYQSQLQLHAIDCSMTASTIVGLVVYTGALGKGSVVERVTRPRTEWIPKPAPPGTIGDVTVQLTCSEISRRPAQ